MSGGAFSFTLSNGFTAGAASSSPVGSTQFFGFISTDAITGLTLSMLNDSWVVLDVVQATAIPVSEPRSALLLGCGLVALVGVLIRRRRARILPT